MKNILNLIFAIVVMMGFSLTSFARNVAAGEDPNDRKYSSEVTEAGTLRVGSMVRGAQVGSCPACGELDVKINDNTNLTTNPESNNNSGTGPSNSYK